MQKFKTVRSCGRKEKIKKDCVSYADGRLYCREEDSGKMIWWTPPRPSYAEKGNFKHRPHLGQPGPIHHRHGKLYIRDQDLLLCYAVK